MLHNRHACARDARNNYCIAQLLLVNLTTWPFSCGLRRLPNMPIGSSCILCKQYPAVSQQYRLVEQLKDDSASFTALGRTLQVLTTANIPCVYPTVVCRKCRDSINKAQKLQEAYLAEVNKLKSMLPSSAVCSTQTPMNSPSRPPLPTITVRRNVLKRPLSANTSPTRLTPQSKRLYSQVSRRIVRPLLPTLCIPPSGISNAQDEQSAAPNVITPTHPTSIQPLLPGPSRNLQSHHPSHTNLATVPRINPAPQGTSVMQAIDTRKDPNQLNASQMATSKRPALKVISNLLKAEKPISVQAIAPMYTQIPTSQAVPLDQPGKIMVHRIIV